MVRATICILMLAAPAWATCPTAADLSAGVQLTLDDGTVETYRMTAPHVVEVSVDQGDGIVSKTMLAKGIYVLSFFDEENGVVDPDSRTNIAFPVNADEIPLPDPLSNASFDTALFEGGAFYKERLIVDWGAQTTVTAGACTYDMIPGQLSYKSDDYDHEEVVHYMPALGIASLYSYFDDDMDAPDVYAVVKIEKAVK